MGAPVGIWVWKSQLLLWGNHFPATIICACKVPLLREKKSRGLNYSSRFVLKISVLSTVHAAIGDRKERWDAIPYSISLLCNERERRHETKNNYESNCVESPGTGAGARRPFLTGGSVGLAQAVFTPMRWSINLLPWTFFSYLLYREPKAAVYACLNNDLSV